MQHTLATAVFDTQEEAQRAIYALREAGASDSSLSVIVRHGNRTTTTSGDGELTDDDHRNLLRGILGGGALGAGLGIAALAIPGVGPLAAAGAIAASLAPEAALIGGAAGAALGTLNESLKKHGVSDEDIEYYGERIKGGGVFVSVASDSGIEPETARQILYRYGGHNSAQPKADVAAMAAMPH